MPITRDKNFYDLLGTGLREYGYTNLSQYLVDMFAEKYNADQIYEQMGFPLNPSLPIRPTYEQIEVNVRPYTMATHVDIDSDGPTKSTDGLSLQMGQLPIWKHETTIGRKELREQLYLAESIGNTTAEIIDVAMEQMFLSTDQLLGGNYNTMRFARHQIVSNEGKLVIDAKNSHLGIPLELDFGVPAKNKKTEAWYTKAASTGKITAKSGVDPIKTLKDVKRDAEQKDNAPRGHWEVSKTTWDDLLQLDAFRNAYAVALNPYLVGKTDAEIRAYASNLPDNKIREYVETVIGAPIVVVDHMGYIEKFNTTTKQLEFVDCPSFVEGVMVYVPDGAIGDTQFGRPFAMETPGARISLYDGGRTLIRQVFNDETMTQTIKSEFTGLPVPNKTRWMYYLTVKGS